MARPSTAGRFLTLPENRSAVEAVRALQTHLQNDRGDDGMSLLYLHGNPGVGKSALVTALVQQLCRQGGLTVQVLGAGDFVLPTPAPEDAEISEAGLPEILEHAHSADLWVIEDLQHLRPHLAECLAQIIESRTRKGQATVVTANAGPSALQIRQRRAPNRLVSRLVGGLVVGLEPWQMPSRLVFLEEWAQRRQFAVAPDILPWVADKLPGSGRVLEGALGQLERLAEQQSKPLTLEQVARHLRSVVDAHEATVDRIIRQVSSHYRLEPGLLRSRGRQRNILVPRQVSMYLARQLTTMSLEQIGASFGGRDHTTVLHACRKVEGALPIDPALSGAIRQLQAQLT